MDVPRASAGGSTGVVDYNDESESWFDEDTDWVTVFGISAWFVLVIWAQWRQRGQKSQWEACRDKLTAIQAEK